MATYDNHYERLRTILLEERKPKLVPLVPEPCEPARQYAQWAAAEIASLGRSADEGMVNTLILIIVKRYFAWLETPLFAKPHTNEAGQADHPCIDVALKEAYWRLHRILLNSHSPFVSARRTRPRKPAPAEEQYSAIYVARREE
jgi:hypothetical protein